MLTDKELAGLVQAARLYYEDGLTQAQVAAKIGVSRPQVSKMLAHAREAGIVHIEIRPPVAGDAELLKLLQQRFGIKGGIVLPQAQREALLRETSEYLAGELRYEKNIGLGWGYTLGEIAGKMASAGGLKGSGKIFPLIGRTAIPNRGYRVNELALLLAGGTRRLSALRQRLFREAAKRATLWKTRRITVRPCRCGRIPRRRLWKYALTPVCRMKRRRCVLKTRWSVSRLLAVCFRTILMYAANLSAAQAILPCACR